LRDLYQQLVIAEIVFIYHSCLNLLIWKILWIWEVSGNVELHKLTLAIIAIESFAGGKESHPHFSMFSL
jgi:hypothetical protein